MEKKTCKICNQELLLSNFRKIDSRFSIRKNKTIDYYRSECKKCESLYGTKNYKIKFKENPNMFKNNEYREKQNNHHKRRYFYYKAIGFREHYNFNISTKELALFFWHTYHHQKGLCAISGRKLTKENMEVDHIIPRTKKIVINDLSNLRLVTKEANKLKSNMDDNTFKQLLTDVYHHFIT
jgi:5-methylcytosine-specific restriction endonuclease McrA